MTDPVTADTSPERGGWHMHAAIEDRHATVHNEVYRCDMPFGDPRPVVPVLVVPVEGLRDRIAKALYEAVAPARPWDEQPEALKSGCYEDADAVLAALGATDRNAGRGEGER